MNQAGPGAGEGTEEKRLKGWKDIAAFLDTSTRTAQRWALKCGLPVDVIRGQYEAYPSRLKTWRDAQTMSYTAYRQQVRAKGGQQRGNQWQNCVAGVTQ